MIANAETEDRPPGLLVLDIGNSAVHLGVWSDSRVSDVQRFTHEDGTGLDQALGSLAGNIQNVEPVAAVIASVAPAVLERVVAAVDRLTTLKPLTVGRDIPLPLAVAVKNPKTVGVDRLCAAAAAYHRVQGRCAVVDFGTAITVDLVDDEGVFQGGAILPGLALQARALAEFTAALPSVVPEYPADPVGRDTTEAIRSGICHGAVGAVRNIVEQIATRLNAWPFVVATGGDLALVAPHCDFIDAAVTDLCLAGVGLAYVKHLNAEELDD
jgi:type III pantothenate kinase